MSNGETSRQDMSQGERDSALFSNLVMQQFSMAMMLMGRSAGPSGEPAPPKDLEAARLFIDQLEMIERKTAGNISKDEEGLVKQALMNLRLAFVEAVEESQKQGATPSAQKGGNERATGEAPVPAPDSPEEPHKKFSKKY